MKLQEAYSVSQWKQKFDYKEGDFSEIRPFLKKVLKDIHLPERHKELVILAIDDTLRSILDYSRGCEGHMDVEARVDDIGLKIQIRESNLESVGNHLDEFLETHSDHKLGIFLARKVMDEISYHFKRGFQNELTLIKYITE